MPPLPPNCVGEGDMILIGFNGGLVVDSNAGEPELEYWRYRHENSCSGDKYCCRHCNGNGCEECDYTGYAEEVSQ